MGGGLGLIATAAGAGLSYSTSLTGAQQQANAAMAQAQAQSQAYMYNAAIAQNNAVAARDASRVDAQQQARINSARHGKLITQVISQGVEMTGTPLLILDEDTAQGAFERQKILHKGDVEATNYQNQATLQRYYADQAMTSGVNSANAAIYQGDVGAARAGVGLLGGVANFFGV